MGLIQYVKLGFASPQLLTSGSGSSNRQYASSLIQRHAVAPRKRKWRPATRPINLTLEHDQTKTIAEIPSIETILERINPIDYVNGPYSMSPTSERKSIRLFGQSEFDVRVVLYRDHAGWCPYCHKVRVHFLKFHV